MHRQPLPHVQKAFTLIEVIVVVVIVGILAATAGPRMLQSIRRGYARDARNNLNIIHGAEQICIARQGSYGTAASLAAINNLCGNTGVLNLVSSGGTVYSCDAAAVPPICTATASAGNGGAATFTMNATLNAPLADFGGNPNCTGGSCP